MRYCHLSSARNFAFPSSAYAVQTSKERQSFPVEDTMSQPTRKAGKSDLSLLPNEQLQFIYLHYLEPNLALASGFWALPYRAKPFYTPPSFKLSRDQMFAD